MSGYKKDEEGGGGVGSFFQDKTVSPPFSFSPAEHVPHRDPGPASPEPTARESRVRADPFQFPPVADRDPRSARLQRDANQSPKVPNPPHEDCLLALCWRDVRHPGGHHALLRSHKAVPAQGRESGTDSASFPLRVLLDLVTESQLARAIRHLRRGGGALHLDRSYFCVAPSGRPCGSSQVSTADCLSPPRYCSLPCVKWSTS